MTAIPETPSMAPIMWEEGRGHREGFQLSLHRSKRRGPGSVGSAVFDHVSGHNLKAEGPQGLYRVMIKFRSFIVFPSAGNT